MNVLCFTMPEQVAIFYKYKAGAILVFHIIISDSKVGAAIFHNCHCYTQYVEMHNWICCKILVFRIVFMILSYNEMWKINGLIPLEPVSLQGWNDYYIITASLSIIETMYNMVVLSVQTVKRMFHNTSHAQSCHCYLSQVFVSLRCLKLSSNEPWGYTFPQKLLFSLLVLHVSDVMWLTSYFKCTISVILFSYIHIIRTRTLVFNLWPCSSSTV